MDRNHLRIAALVFGLSAFGMIIASGSLEGIVVLLGPFCGLIGAEPNGGSWETVRLVFTEIGHYLLLGIVAQFLIKSTEAGNLIRYIAWGLTCLVWVFGSILAVFAQMG